MFRATGMKPWPRTAALAGGAAVLWLATLLYAQSAGRLIADEAVHVPQIQAFLRGDFAAHPLLTTIPGYHAIVAVAMRALGAESIAWMRAIGALFGIVAALLFHAIRRRMDDAQPARSAALLFFLPFLYPYDFLVYTDVLSLALVLGALLCALDRRHVAAALAVTGAVLVRQNNVVWAGFLPLFALWPALERERWRVDRCFGEVLRVGGPYVIPVTVFCAYWAWNGTISLSKAVVGGHPDMELHAGNVYFALFLFFVFFPYETWTGARRFLARARRARWLFLLPLLVFAVARLKGSYDNSQFTDYFIRNAIVQAVRHGDWARWLFGAAVAVAACGVAAARFNVRQGWLVYPFAAFYLSSSLLIENRYSIIPFALWMALQRSGGERADWIRLAAWIVASLFFAWGVFGGRFML